MEWQRAFEEERAALMRLVALLHAFAGLAERAAGRSAVIRGIVLWILRRAEPIARDFVVGEEDLPPEIDPWSTATGPSGNRPEDALRLAETFRALAFELEAQATVLVLDGDGRAGRTGNPGVRRAAAETLAALSAFASFALLSPHLGRAPDTS